MLRALMLALIGGGAFVAVYAATAPEPAPLPQTPTKTAALPDLEQAPTMPVSFELRPSTTDELDTARESVAIAIRDVTPTNMTSAPPSEEPPARAEQPAQEAAAAAPKAKLQRLFNPVVGTAGSVETKGRTILFAGIAAPEVDRRCGSEATAWPCGRMARAALRRFIRGRAVECEIPVGAEAIPDKARCFVAGEDISSWLVMQGWAESDGSTFDDAEKSAREAKMGLFGDGWPGGQPAALASGN
jgi:endonuclease YncB( thermonuclease family)